MGATCGYQAAGEEVHGEHLGTSSPKRNWFRDLAIASILRDTIADLKPAYPTPPELPKNLVIE